MLTNDRVVFVFAHQDDEIAVAPRIADEVRAGHRVQCVYLTNGETPHASSATRCAESDRVLRTLGVAPDDIGFIGSALGIDDGQLGAHQSEAYAAFAAWLSRDGSPIGRLYCLALEGGHHDHDASHLVALRLARERGITAMWQFPLYNGHGTHGRFFRVMHALPKWGKPDTKTLTVSDGLRYALLCSKYPSQWRTWIGLFPGLFTAYALLRRHRVYQVAIGARVTPPHHGPLLYERMFGVDRSFVVGSDDSRTLRP